MKTATTLFLLSIASYVCAQNLSFKNRIGHFISLDLQANATGTHHSLSYDFKIGVAKNIIELGIGAGMSMGNLRNEALVTAFPNRPANGNFTQLSIEAQTIYALQLRGSAEIRPLHWLQVGALIDLVGFSFGQTGQGQLLETNTPVTTNTEALNAFLGGRNDKGSLNSQFFIRFWPSTAFSIKVGASIVHYIINSSEPDSYGNRFFTDPKMIHVGITYAPRRPMTMWPNKTTNTEK